MCMFINRDCVSGQFFLPVGEVRRCVNQCSPQTTCGPIVIPEDHLKVASRGVLYDPSVIIPPAFPVIFPPPALLGRAIIKFLSLLL